MNAFEQWWLDGHGPHWKGYISQFEYDNCQSAWNAAIDAAIIECDNWIKIINGSCGYGLEDCKEEIQKLKSE